MIKNKSNEVAYHLLSHHIDHYIQAKKLFKTDYDSHVVTIGGMHGDEYLPQFINFFKENLL